MKVRMAKTKCANEGKDDDEPRDYVFEYFKDDGGRNREGWTGTARTMKLCVRGTALAENKSAQKNPNYPQTIYVP